MKVLLGVALLVVWFRFWVVLMLVCVKSDDQSLELIIDQWGYL